MASKHSRDSATGLNVPDHQSDGLPSNLKQETVIIPFDSQLAFNSYATCTIREKGCIINDITIVTTLTGISGVSGATTVSYLPLPFLFTRLEIASGGNVLDQYFPEQQHLAHQLFLENDERRALHNAGLINYASITGSNVNASNEYYINTWSMFKTAQIPLVFPNHDIQLRCYTDSLTNIVFQVGGSGTATASITSAQALVRLTRLPPDTVAQLQSTIQKIPRHYMFSEVKQMVQQLASGITTTQIVLTGITGRIDTLMFIVRASSPTGSNKITYTAVQSYEILDSSSTNIVGGSAITDRRARLHLGRYFSNTSFLSESGQNVYVYSWSVAPGVSQNTGQHLGSYNFRGSEQLRLTFASALGSAQQVDIYGMCISALEVNPVTIKKISA